MAVARPVPAQRSYRLPRNPLVLAVAGGALVALVLIAASLLGSHKSAPRADAPLLGVAAANELLAGIPQHGVALGSPAAPATLEEFADLQCPYCARWAGQVLPQVVNRYVRGGKLRLVFRPMAFIGPDSVRAARFAVGAGRQGRLWQLVDVLYANQGAENSGWASADFLTRVAKPLSIDAAQATAFGGGATASSQLASSGDEADALGVNSTPTIVLRVKGAPPRTLDPFDLPALFAALDAAAAR
jgi:protein-disulfide isomerase